MDLKKPPRLDALTDGDSLAEFLSELSGDQPPLLDIRQPVEPKFDCALLAARNELLPHLNPARP